MPRGKRGNFTHDRAYQKSEKHRQYMSEYMKNWYKQNPWAIEEHKERMKRNKCAYKNR